MLPIATKRSHIINSLDLSLSLSIISNLVLLKDIKVLCSDGYQGKLDRCVSNHHTARLEIDQ